MKKHLGGSKAYGKKTYDNEKIISRETVKSLIKSIKSKYSLISESFKIIADINELNIDEIDYYNLYRKLLERPLSIYDEKNRLTRDDLENIKIISPSDYREKLLLNKICVRNQLSTFYTDNIDTINYINNNITEKTLKSIKKLSPIIEKSNESRSESKGGRKRIFKKGGGGLKQEGHVFLSILHILDRKHDFIEGVNDDMTLYINTDSTDNIDKKLLGNLILKDKVLELYKRSKSNGYEDKIVLDILNKIIDNKYIENTMNYINFCFIDIGKAKEKLDIYELKKMSQVIDVDKAIANDIYDKIINIIKVFYGYATAANIKYLLDIDIKTNVNSLDKNVYPNIGTQLHPFEDVFDPHSSARIVVDPANIDLYKNITNSNFNSPVGGIVENIYSAIRDITRKYINFDYYEESHGLYYPSLLFLKDIRFINIFKIFIDKLISIGANKEQIIPNKVLYFFAVDTTSGKLKTGLYYKNSFNTVDALKHYINKLIKYKNTNDKANFEIEFNDTTYNITSASLPKYVIIHLLIVYLYYTIKLEKGSIQFNNILADIIDILFDLKKAGDWGQSLFCSKYNEKIINDDCFFVSGDRLSAMRSILSTNVKTIFTTDYNIINSSSTDKQTMMSLFKNLNMFTFKNFVEYLKVNIFKNDEYKYYIDDLQPQYFYKNTAGDPPFNEDALITDANFNPEFIIKIIHILKYLFLNYLAKNSLIGIQNKQEIILPNPASRNVIVYIQFPILLGLSIVDINAYIKETKKLNPNMEEIFNIYISDYKNETIPLNINILDCVKIFNDIANLNKLYNLLFCHTEQDKIANNISKIKEIFETNTKDIVDFIDVFNTQFNNTSVMKNTITKYYIHKSLFESYTLFLEYTKMITYIDKIIPHIKPSRINNFILKFREQTSISEDNDNFNLMAANINEYWSKIPTISGFVDVIDDKTRIKYATRITNKYINKYIYNYYINTVLPYINKSFIIHKDGITNYDRFINECYDKLQSISSISSKPKQSFNIMDLRAIIETKKNKTYEIYSELHKLINDLYIFNIDTDLYYVDPKNIPESSNAVSISNKIFKEIDEEIPAPNPDPSARDRPAPRNETSSRRRKTEPSSSYVVDTKTIGKLYDLIVRRENTIENLNDKSITPSFLLNIKLDDDNKDLNSMIKQITLTTFIIEKLNSIQDANNILNDLSSYLNGEYKIIAFIKSNAITYFFSENYKVIDILKKYLKFIFEKISIYITEPRIKDYGLKSLFNDNSFTKLKNYSQQLDILYNTLHADYKPPVSGRRTGPGTGPGTGRRTGRR